MLMRALIQARMSSQRLPGKVMTPLAGRPMIGHVIQRALAALPRESVTLATSVDPSDDRLAQYVQGLGVDVFRGDLTNVLGRFQACLQDRPCDWFVRISGDSPLLDPSLIDLVRSHAGRRDLDLVTNVQRRTFPKGQSVEMVRTSTFLALDGLSCTPEEREHVTLHFYNNPHRFKILNLEAPVGTAKGESDAVDAPEDLARVEAKLKAAPAVPPLRGPGALP